MSAYDASQLLRMSQEQLDALFLASPAGDIPEGSAEGTLIVAPGTRLAVPIAELVRRLAWQGKVFDPRNGSLKNRILPFGFEAVLARVYKGRSWLDGKECIVLDYLKTSLVARWIRDEIRLISPACHLGVVYLGKERLTQFCLRFRT